MVAEPRGESHTIAQRDNDEGGKKKSEASFDLLRFFKIGGAVSFKDRKISDLAKA